MVFAYKSCRFVPGYFHVCLRNKYYKIISYHVYTVQIDFNPILNFYNQI